MTPIPPKKLLILNILEILRKHSDEEHRLSQKDILSYLKEDYQMIADRKAVKRNLLNLVDNTPYQIGFTRSERLMPSGELEEVYSDWYYMHDFTSEEIHQLIHSVLLSNQIAAEKKDSLIHKLEVLQNDYFQPHVRHIHSLPIKEADTTKLLEAFSIFDQAFKNDKCLQLTFCPQDESDSSNLIGLGQKPVSIVINPYTILAFHGDFFIVGTTQSGEISINAVRKIHKIQIMNSPAAQPENLPEIPLISWDPVWFLEGDQRSESKKIRVGFETSRNQLNALLDSFAGSEMEIEAIDSESVRIYVTVEKDAMNEWVKHCPVRIQMISPEVLGDKTGGE